MRSRTTDADLVPTAVHRARTTTGSSSPAVPRRWRPTALAALAAVLALSLGAPAWAQDRDAPKPGIEVSVGGRLWLTTGRTDWLLNNLVDNPASKLDWKRTSATAAELNVEAMIHPVYGRVTLGGASVGSGTMIDDDWDKRGHFSSTKSNIDDGSLGYVVIDAGYRMVAQGKRGQHGYLTVDGFVGYLGFSEEYSAYGVYCLDTADFTCVGNRQAVPTSIKAGTQDYSWRAARLGVRGETGLGSAITLSGHVAWLPFGTYKMDDIHHLRDDLEKTPSIRTTSGDLSGVEVEAGLRWQFMPSLSAELGYRYWNMDVEAGGKVVFYFADGTRARVKVHSSETTRHGVFTGVVWRF